MPKPRSQKPRFAIALLVLAALVTLAFALPWSRASRPEEPEPAESLPPEPQIERLLDDVLADLRPDQSPWLETTIRQRVHLPGVAYTAEGRYQTAPGHRCRLELRTQTGQASGTLLVVSDGQHLWRGQRVGDGAWTTVQRAGLGPCFETEGVGNWPKSRGDNGMSFSGVAPLLRNLRRTLDWVSQSTDANGEVVLTGVWPAARRAALAPPGQSWPLGLPRRCQLTLDAATHWPRRVEWWGPQAEGNHNQLLAELEFRDPVRNQPLTPEQCATAFAFDPGLTPVTNQAGTAPAAE
jgi:hypothetical protein